MNCICLGDWVPKVDSASSDATMGFIGQLWDFAFSLVHMRSAPHGAPKILKLKTFLETKFKFLQGSGLNYDSIQ